MKEPTRAPSYAVIYHGLCDIARRHGYALAIHGSVLTDLDLIAVPWIDDAADPFTLKEAIKKHCGMCLVNIDMNNKEHDHPVSKPHGRWAWKLHMNAGGSVDLSVMPKLNQTEYD